MLPTPLAITALGTALLVAAGLIFWLAPLTWKKYALYFGIAGAFILSCAGVALGYEKMGEEKLEPVLLACQTDLGTVKQANTDLQDSVTRIRAEVDHNNHVISALSADTATAQGQAVAIRKAAEQQAANLKAMIAGYQAMLDTAPQKVETDAQAKDMLTEVDAVLTRVVGP